MSDVEQVEEEIEISAGNASSNRCVNVTLQIIFSTPGLVVLVVMYSVMGALIFPLLEAPNEIHAAMSVSNSREECLKELWTITDKCDFLNKQMLLKSHGNVRAKLLMVFIAIVLWLINNYDIHYNPLERLNVLYERNWTLLVHEQLRRFEGTIVAATRGGLVETMGDRFPRWSFSEALLYSVTVITTIGHGNLIPRTSEGKIVTMLYALFGVPLMLMCLSSLGGFLADALAETWFKLCGTRDGNNENEMHECTQEEDEMDCNICKYDAVCKETRLQTYDKYTPVSDREDSCHLIHNSPAKSAPSPNQHQIVCMQTLKKTNTHSNQQPPQQQYLIATRDSLPTNQNHHLNQIHQHMENDVQKTNPNSYYSMNRMQCHNHVTAQQINSNYQGIQLQGHLLNKNDRTDHRVQQQQQQPYHHQQQHTATVHGLGRSKFVPKPMPQEINMLLAECDRNCHHEYTDTATPTSNKCGGNLETLEDDDDDENRVGCHHGTPSRMPLIKQPHNAQKPSEFNANVISNEQQEEIDQNSQTTHNPQVPITIILLILTTYICIGTVIFSLWENWSIVDGAYFCFVTLSTIGFGDLEPKKTFHGPELQLFACCSYLILGLVLVAMSFSLLETQLLWKCRRMAVRLKLAHD